MMRTTFVGLVAAWCVLLAGAGAARPQDDVSAPVPGALSEYDRVNLEQNLRWMVARERSLRDTNAKPLRERVAVYADAGAWHLGTRSIVELLENQDISCRLLDRSLFTKDGLAGFECLILPGGWAPHQCSALGKDGLAAVEGFVTNGGRCLGVCAGGYLLAKTVRYEDKKYPYPLGLFDGTAVGPVSGLPPFPKPGACRLKVTEAGKKRGLEKLADRDCYYCGGPYFADGTNVQVLATYPDGSAAAIVRPVGKGEIVLIGVHLERPEPAAGDDTAAPPRDAGKMFKALLFPEGR
jgi:glutamine amidotransferase-like uncharacterized protein